MVKLANIHSLTDFQRNAKSFAVQAKETKEPMVLTVNGRAELVLQDAQAYQELLDRLDYAESVVGILQSMEEFENREGIPVKQAFEQLRRKHGLSD
jgi:PHD/YefM family antitoxin component YafN of YafNO toxin-antitoxin module